MSKALDIIRKYQQKESASPAMNAIVSAKAAEREQRKAALMEEYSQVPSAMTGDTGRDFLAGVGSGMMGIVKGAGNMMGLVDDEEIAEKKRIDEELSGTGIGSTGQFVGEMAALAPLGVVGKGAQVAHKAIRGAGMLPTAAKILTGAGSIAAVEGGLAGAIAANPNERGTGATISATGGLVLNKLFAALSRTGLHGLAKTSQSAKDLIETVEKKIGKRPFIPLNQAVDIHAGPITARSNALMDAISMLPSARAKMIKQADEFAQDMYETNIRQVFGGNKANTAAKVLRATDGDVQKALEAGKNAGKNALFSPTQKVLDTAARTSPKGQYAPKHLIRSAQKAAGEGDIGFAPLRETALKMQDTMGRPVGTSTVAARDAYHTVSNILGTLADTMPGLGPMLGSKSLQNFLMGNLDAQRALQKAMASGEGKAVRAVLSNIRRTISIQPVVADDKSFLDESTNYVKDLSSKLLSKALRGNQ